MKRFPLVFLSGMGTNSVTPALLIGNIRRSLCLVLVLLTPSAFATDRTEEVRATEIAFAKAFAERDAKKFFGVPRGRRPVSRAAQNYAWETRGDGGLVRIL